MNLLLLAGAIVITVLVFLWLIRVIKATLKTALLIAAIVFGLSFFGIGTDRIFGEIDQIIRSIWRAAPSQQNTSSLEIETLIDQIKTTALGLISHSNT
jgi:hypothetical protein